MVICACCGENDKDVAIDKAHVKDRIEMLKENIENDTYKNIILLCKNCHYVYFDAKNRMYETYNLLGLKKINEWWYFFKLDKKTNKIEKIKSKTNLDILTENVTWKNNFLHPRIRLSILKN